MIPVGQYVGHAILVAVLKPHHSYEDIDDALPEHASVEDEGDLQFLNHLARVKFKAGAST